MVWDKKINDTHAGIEPEYKTRFDMTDVFSYTGLSALHAFRIITAIDSGDDSELDRLLSIEMESLIPVEAGENDRDGVEFNIEPDDALPLVRRDLFKYLVKYAKMNDRQKQKLASSFIENAENQKAKAAQRVKISRGAGLAKAAINPVTQSIQTELKQMWLEYRKEELELPKNKRKFKSLSSLFRSFQEEYGNQSDFNTLRENVKRWKKEESDLI